MARIAIDAMGSDNGSKMVVASVKKYKMDHPETIFYVCGREEELQELKGIAEIVDARDVMGMEDGALAVMRNRNTSMYKACDLVANGTCDGVVSAGSTGAFLTCATIRLKMIEGIHRACLCTTFPTSDGKGVTILDIGANNENQPEHLVQFAKIGEVYAKKVRNIDNPRIYLISNGAEDKKGSPLIKATNPLLRENNKYFKGNLEARYALSGEADVLVTPGFEGNILLKSTEGTAKMVSTLLNGAFRKNIFTKIGYLFARKGIKQMKDTMNYKKYGGAMLLGVNGAVVKGHGNSDEESFYNAIKYADLMIQTEVVNKIKDEFTNANNN